MLHICFTHKRAYLCTDLHGLPKKITELDGDNNHDNTYTMRISDAILLSAGSFTSVLKGKLRNPHTGRKTVGDDTSS